MKTILKLITFMLSVGSAQQSKAVFYDWGRYYDGGGIDRGLHVQTDALANVYFTGVAALPGGSKIISSAYNDAGTLLWQRTANTFLPGTVKQVERDDALNTFVLCEISPSSFTLIRYNANAVEKWRRNYSNFALKFKVGDPGAVYICGLTAAGVVMRRMNKISGATIWTRSYPDASLLGNSSNSDFTIDVNSNLYFSGTSDGSADYDYKMVKLTKNGGVVYNIQYNTGAGKDEETFKIAANDAGELYILGDFDCEIPVRDYVSMVKFNAAGAYQWHTQFATSSTSGRYSALDVMVGPDGNPVGVGNMRDFYNVNPAGETVRITVTKFNGITGAVIFDVTPDDAAYSSPDLIENAKCMTIDATNNIYIGGSSNVYAGVTVAPYRWLALKVIGSTGNREWVEAGVGDDDALNEIADVAVTPVNDSYWAGSEKFSGNVNMWLNKYCEVGCFSPRMGTSGADESAAVIYPNPSVSSFTFSNGNSDGHFTLSVYDLSGKLVEDKDGMGTVMQFGENLAPGSYIVRFVNATETRTMRIVKTQ
jgi:hypothetical protein